MTYLEILDALSVGKCESTRRALESAVDEEAIALIEGTTSHGMFKASRGARRVPNDLALSAARDFYAEDISRWLADAPTVPQPHQVLTHRRLAVAWAVAEVLRTNDLA